MTTINKHIKGFFERFTDKNEFFFTQDHLEDNGSDQQAFFKENDASQHAKNLKDKTVTRITREEAMAESKPTGPTPLELAEKARTKAEDKVAKAGAKVKNSADAMMKAEEALKQAEEAKKAVAEDAAQKVKDKAQAAIDKAAGALQKAADQHKINLDELALAGAEASKANEAVEELKKN